WGSSPSTVMEPAKPRRRSSAAAPMPAWLAPMITMRSMVVAPGWYAVSVRLLGQLGLLFGGEFERADIGQVRLVPCSDGLAGALGPDSGVSFDAPIHYEAAQCDLPFTVALFEAVDIAAATHMDGFLVGQAEREDHVAFAMSNFAIDLHIVAGD